MPIAGGCWQLCRFTDAAKSFGLLPPSILNTPGIQKRSTCFAGASLSLSIKSTGSLKNASIFSKRCRPLRRTSSGQSPHRSSWPDGQASLRFLAPPLPNKPASLGFVWGPDSHACRLSRVFSEAHVPGKNRLNLIPSSADDGTLRGSCTKSEVFLLFRQAERSTCFAGASFALSGHFRFRTRLGPHTVGRRVCAVRVFCRRQNLGAGAIYLPRACSISEGWRQPLAAETQKERHAFQRVFLFVLYVRYRCHRTPA